MDSVNVNLNGILEKEFWAVNRILKVKNVFGQELRTGLIRVGGDDVGTCCHN